MDLDEEPSSTQYYEHEQDCDRLAEYWFGPKKQSRMTQEEIDVLMTKIEIAMADGALDELERLLTSD